MGTRSYKVQLALLAAVVVSPPEWAVHENGARSDTTWYGRYVVAGDDYYAVPHALKSDAVWTFDRGIGPIGDPGRIDGGEGWAAINLASFEEALFRVIDAGLDLGPGVLPPVLEGAASLWVGANASEANGYGYECLAGYGNRWCQLAISSPSPMAGRGRCSCRFSTFRTASPSMTARRSTWSGRTAAACC